MLYRVLNIISMAMLVIGLVVCVVIGGCDVTIATMSGSVPMKCVWGFMAVAVFLAVGLVCSAAALALKTTEAKRFAALAVMLVAVAVAIIPSPLAVELCSWDGSAMCCANLAQAGASTEELAWCAATMAWVSILLCLRRIARIDPSEAMRQVDIG